MVRILKKSSYNSSLSNALLSRKRLILILLSVFLLAFLMGMYWVKPILRSAWYSTLSASATNYYQESLIHFSTLQQSTVPPGYLLAYGDSLIQGLGVQALRVPVVNYGIGHARISTIARQLEQHNNLQEAGTLLLAVGINDVVNGDPDAVIAGYRDIVLKLPAEVPVWVQLIQPVDEKLEKLKNLNNSISTLNSKLRAFCTQYEHWSCIEPSPKLFDSQGQLASQYHSGDGLHLNKLGNAVWLDTLSNQVKKSPRLRRWSLDPQ